MKKNRNLLIIVLLLGSATAFFVLRNGSGTLKEELKEFAVKDTAEISKIFLADRNGNQIILQRTSSSEWILNEKFKPKKDILKNLLDALYRIDVRNKVAKAAYNNVIKTLASTGIKCEIYLNGDSKPSKTIYVGGQTEDALGTFMMLENSSVPFITHIPGFNGYLTPRFSTDPNVWKQTVLFSYRPEEIKSVGIEYLNFPENSFLLKNESGKLAISGINHLDTTAAINFLDLFRIMYFEVRDEAMKPASRDSMLALPPSILIRVEDKANKVQEVLIYPMTINRGSLTLQDSTGTPLKFDVDRVYGFRRPENELVIIQHYNFDRVLRRLSDFDADRKQSFKKH